MNIGKATAASGVSQRMIRRYEMIGLIPKPDRRYSGYRDYDMADIHRLRFIANARDLGFPIEEIRSLLSLWRDQARSSADMKTLALVRAGDLCRKALAIETMRAQVIQIAEACVGDDRPDLIVDHLAGDEGSVVPARITGMRGRKTT